MAERDAGAVRIFNHLRALFLSELWGATGVDHTSEPREYRRDHRHPRSPGASPGRAPPLAPHPFALAALGRPFARRSRRKPLIKKETGPVAGLLGVIEGGDG